MGERDTLTTLSIIKTTADIGKQILEHAKPLLEWVGDKT